MISVQRDVAMAAIPPDHAKRALLQRLSTARSEAKRLGFSVAASLIGMTILSISPTWTDSNDDPVAQNDNGSHPDKV
jgi:hypothetical protein